MKFGMHILQVLALLGVPAMVCATQHAPAHNASSPTHSARKHPAPQEKSAKSSMAAHPLTLEQAVARVQNQTGGKVLKADAQNRGRIVEYRIKVLTPDGHVRVVTLRSDGHDAQ